MPYIEWLRKDQCKWLWKVEVRNEIRSRQQNQFHFPAPFFSFSGNFLWWFMNIIVSVSHYVWRRQRERKRQTERQNERSAAFLVSYLTNWKVFCKLLYLWTLCICLHKTEEDTMCLHLSLSIQILKQASPLIRSSPVSDWLASHMIFWCIYL